MGFFSGIKLDVPTGGVNLPKCGKCQLYLHCQSPKMPVSGKGRRGVLVVAEAPGKTEDKDGVQLVGEAGRLLRSRMKSIGWNLDRDCWKTNAVVCRPSNNRTPTDAEVEYCRPNLLKAIKELQPRVILPLGRTAVQSIIGHVWKDVGPIGKWVGLKVPMSRYNAWVCPTWHPSYLLRDLKNDALDLLFRHHLESALSLDDPLPRPLDLSSMVEIVANPDQVADAIDGLEDGPLCWGTVFVIGIGMVC